MGKVNPNDYDLVQVIELYTPLRKDGAFYKGSEHDSLVVDPRKNLFNWNSVGVHGDIFEWVKYTHGTDFRGALDIIQRNFPKTYSQALVEQARHAYTRLAWDLAEEHHGHLTGKDWAWWHGRGVWASTVSALKLGRHYDYYTIPIPDWSQRYLANYKLRASRADMRPRYKQYCKNLEPILYVPRPSIVEDADTVVFVAGEIKAIVLAQYGIPAVSSSTGCATWYKAWSVWFREKRVTQCFDAKEQEAAESVRLAMGSDVPSAEIENVVPPHDIDDWLVLHGASLQEIKDFLRV